MSLKVSELMTAAPLVTVGPDDDLERAGQTMAWTRVRHLPVLEEGRLVGLLSERDFIRARAQPAVPGVARTVRAAMRTPVAWVGPDDAVETALGMMVSHNYGCLPVVSHEALVGMLTTTDLLRHQLYSAFERPPAAAATPAFPAAVAPAGELDLRIEPVGRFQFRVRFDKDSYPALQTDEPPPLGTDAGPDPARLLAAAVGTCLSASLRFCLQKTGAGAEEAAVSADVHLQLVRNERKRLRVGHIAVRLHPPPTLDPRALVSCLAGFEDFCIVTESVRRGIEVRVAVDGVEQHAADAAE